MRIANVRHLADYNVSHPCQQAFVIRYDDFNPFLDRFRKHLRSSPAALIACWGNGAWDHMDAILCRRRDATGGSSLGR